MIPFGQIEVWILRQDVDMTLRVCAVVVKLVPERLNEKGKHLFFSELESCMNVDRPSIVFDCSKVLQVDRAAAYLLLCCLEEAIKRNGDVKLAAVPAGARTMLELTGADRLFEIFDTNAEAVNSFLRLPLSVTPSAFVPGSSLRPSEN